MTRPRTCALLLAVPVAWLVVRVNTAGLPDVPITALPGPDLATLGIGVPAAIGLWVWMFAHYWRHPPENFRVFWTLALLLGLHIGALAYCLLVYGRPGTGPGGPARR